MHSRSHLYQIRRATDRLLELQQHMFGSLFFGPLYLLFTVWWAREAVRMGWDNAGLTIYTFIVSCLAIYYSWVVTNILNRTSARDRARDDLEAAEIEAMFALVRELRAQQNRILALLENEP